MASLSDDNSSNLKNEGINNEEEIEDSKDDQESKNENASQNENTTSVDVFGTNRPINICSPISFQSSHKPVFGTSRSILKPSTLFTDSNVTASSVTFANNNSKTVKLKPSVLANPFVNNESDKSIDLKANCDEKSDKLPSSEEESSSKEDVSNSSTSVPLKFVPLNGPPTTPTATLASTATSVNTTNISTVSSSESTSTTNSSSFSTAFVFGQNLHERVTMENDDAQKPEEAVTQNGVSFSEMLFSSAIKQESANNKQKDKASHEFSNGNTKTLSVSAKEYEEARNVKRKYEEVAVVTGEEDEQNVIQINCKLFAFDNASSSWAERGRGTLRVNDKETSEGRTSRLVMRLLGNLRVVLNTKIWSEMSVQHASKKSVRLTAIDNDGQVRIYLVMASPKDSEHLYNVLSTRIQKKKLKTSSEQSASTSSTEIE